MTHGVKNYVRSESTTKTQNKKHKQTTQTGAAIIGVSWCPQTPTFDQ